jgi:hypothetical protein
VDRVGCADAQPAARMNGRLQDICNEVKRGTDMIVEYKEHDGVVEVPLWDFLRMAAVLKVWVHDYESYPEEHDEAGVHLAAEKEMKLVLNRIEVWIGKRVAKDPETMQLWQQGWEVLEGKTDEQKGSDWEEE